MQQLPHVDERYADEAALDFEEPLPFHHYASPPASPTPSTPLHHRFVDHYDDEVKLWPPFSDPSLTSPSTGSLHTHSLVLSSTSPAIVAVPSPYESKQPPDVQWADEWMVEEERRRVVPVAAVVALPSGKRRRRVRPSCASACVPCRVAKTACDDCRPCTRCVAQRRGADCADRTEEDIQRARMNRGRRKQRDAAVSTPSTAPSSAATEALQNLRLHSSTICLAAAHNTGVSGYMLQHVQQLSALPAEQRRRALRAVHIGLAHMADHLDVGDFVTFLRGLRPTRPLPPEVAAVLPESASPSPAPPPSSSAPLPAALSVWSHPTQRPMYLDFSSTPSTCAADDASAAGEAPVATVRVHLLPAARANLIRWETQFDASVEGRSDPSGSTAAEHGGRQDDQADASTIDSISSRFVCLSVEDTACSSGQANAVAAAAPLRSHASWCATQRPFASEGSAAATAAFHECSCKDSVALPCALVVNAAWERLFGWSQEEVRRGVLRRGMRALSDCYRLDSLYAYHALIDSNAQHAHPQAGVDGSDFSTFAVMRNKWGADVSCMVHKKTAVSDGFTSTIKRFIVLTAGNAHVPAT